MSLMSRSSMTNDGSWREQFLAIDSLLMQTRQYWQILPFSYLALPWLENQTLNQALSTLSLQDIDEIDVNNKQLRQFVGSLINVDLDIIDDLQDFSMPAVDVSPHFSAGIKGRKWAQIQQFSALIPPQNSPILEWCAGKGHLGRLLSHQQARNVLSLEWQSQLCEQGNALANKHQVPQRVEQVDVFTSDVENLIESRYHAVALHACGDLHVRLLKLGTQQKLSRLSLAPCCYHLIQSQSYVPLSTLGLQSRLSLSKQDLSLSMQQSVVSSAREQQHRMTEVSWRLAFDLIQRDVRNINEYLPLPSIKQSMLTGSFATFCGWAAAQKNIVLPDDLDYNAYELSGGERFLIIRQIEVVTHAFRQLLERWLLLDRVLFLKEHHYDVSLFNFCASSMTPRNAMIQAIKKPT